MNAELLAEVRRLRREIEFRVDAALNDGAAMTRLTKERDATLADLARLTKERDGLRIALGHIERNKLAKGIV